MKKESKKLWIGVMSIILIIGLIGGYKLAFINPKASGDESARIGEITSEEADREAQRINEQEDKLLAIDSQGSVQFGAMFLNPIEDDDKYLIFETQIGTHSVNLDEYDFGKAAEFKTSEGIILKDEVIWEKIEGEGHHYLGYYKVPKVIDGKPVITKDTSFIELNIKNVDNVENRILKWDKEALESITE